MAKKVQPVSINDVEFDALIDDSRTLPNSVPSYPVEDGFSISDTIIHSPQTLSITVYVGERLPLGVIGVYSKLASIGREDFKNGKAIFAYIPQDGGVGL